MVLLDYIVWSVGVRVMAWTFYLEHLKFDVVY